MAQEEAKTTPQTEAFKPFYKRLREVAPILQNERRGKGTPDEIAQAFQVFKEAPGVFVDSLRSLPEEREKVAKAIADGKTEDIQALLKGLYVTKLGKNREIDTDYYSIFQNAYEAFLELYSSSLKETMPKSFAEFVAQTLHDKVQDWLMGRENDVLVPVEEKPVVEVRPASASDEVKGEIKDEGTKEQKTTLQKYPQTRSDDKLTGEVNLPERPPQKDVGYQEDEKQKGKFVWKNKDKDGNNINAIIDKKTAEAVLNLPFFYKLSARERARMKEAAGVELTKSNREKELGKEMEYRPYGYYFSELIDKYEEYQEELGEKLRQKVIKESEGKPDASKQLAAVLDSKREDADRDPKMYIAGAMQVLLSMIARRRYEGEEVANLRAIIDSCEHIINIYDTPESREKAAEFRKIQESLSYFAEGAIELVEYWQHYLTGDEALMTTTFGAAKGTTAKMNEIMFLWWHDPGIVKSFHTSSVRSKDDLQFATKLSYWEGKTKVIYETEKVPGYDNRYSLKKNDRKKVAQDVIGEILNVASLKVRMDPYQAADIAYTVYREDQFGMQHSDQKYDAEAFRRMLRVNRAGHIELINNNEMATLFTFENSTGLIEKWLDLIKKSADYKETGIFIGRKNLAALISWAGEIDPRKPGNNPGEALDFDTFLELLPIEQDKLLKIHLERFLDNENFSNEERQKILQRNLARGRTRLDETRKLKKPIAVQSKYTGEIKVLECVPILEPVIDLDETWFNPETKQWEYCLNTRWFFQEEPGIPLAIRNQDVASQAAQAGPGEATDPKDVKNKFFAREGQIAGQTPVNVSTLFIYEGYKQSDSKLLATMIKAGSVSLYQEHQKLLQQLSSEDRGKQSYSIPEYYVGIVNHLIDQAVREEIFGSLYVARYAGRHMEFFQQLEPYKRFIDFQIDEKIDFETTNTEGSYGELMSAQRVPPEKRMRQLLMRNAYRPVWEHFAKEDNNLTLEELLAFAGLQEKTQNSTRKNVKNEKTGYMELEIIEETSKKWEQTPGEWKKHDDWQEDMRKASEAEKSGNYTKSASLEKVEDLITKNPNLEKIYYDFRNSNTFKTSIFTKWDLWTQTRKIVLKYVDDLFIEHETVPENILKQDRIVAEIIRDREFKKKEYGELYGDPDRDPKSLRWVTFDDGKKHEMHDLWKRRQIYNKILREHQFPMGDEMVNGKFMFTQWEDLEFLENGTANPNYHQPKIKIAKIKDDGTIGDDKYFNEIPELHPDERNLAMSYNEFRQKEQEVMKKYEVEREDIEKMPRKTSEQENAYQARRDLYLYNVKKESGENPLAKTHYVHSPLSGMGGGLCQGLDLSAGWWEFQPETGLTERWPDWLEPEFVVGMAAMWSAPYRMAMAERLADVAFRHKHKDLIKDVKFVTPAIRKSHEWIELYEPKVDDQMLVAMGPDHYSNLIFKLRGEYTEGFMDNEPAKELLARQLGVDDEGKIGRRYIKYLHKLNFRGGKVDLPFEDPEAWKELDESLKSERSKISKDIQKSPVLEALPDGAKALAMLIGDDPKEFIESGKTNKDAPGKFVGRFVLPFVPIAPAAAVLLTAPSGLPGWVFGNNMLTMIASLIPAGIMGASGWILNKDREKGKLVPARFAGQDVVDFEEINSYQSGKIKEYYKHWWEKKKTLSKIATIGLPFLIPIVPPLWPLLLTPLAAPLSVGLNYIINQKLGIKIFKPLAQRRMSEVSRGRAHTAIIDPKSIIVKVGTDWKERFGSSLAGHK